MRGKVLHVRWPRVLAVVAIAAGGLAMAPAAVRAVAEEPCADWPMYGASPARTFEAPCPSAIDPSSVARLAPAWFFDTAKPVTASPTVADGVVYVGSWERVMYALDAASGAVIWEHEVAPSPGAAFGPIVSSAAVADTEIDGESRRLVLFGTGPDVVALDASDGQEVWVHDASAGVADTPTEYESSPVVVGDLVLIGRDTHNQGTDATGGVRGGLVALDVATGSVEWTFEPELDQAGAGCGGVWGSPTVDVATDLVYVGTANCPEDDYEWTPHVNAVTALELATGTPVWAFQPSGPPDDDSDFGATPNLFVDADGRKVLGAGKKDGTYYALDPANGELLWSTQVTDPVPGVGGFIGSPAVYEGDVFGGTAIGTPPFFHSIDGATGAIRFQGGIGPSYGATAVVNGVAFNAALDDLLKAYDTETGLLLWSSPLSGPSSSGPAIAGDMVFVGAGTTTTDVCEKGDEQCALLFDDVLSSLGGVHAFRLLGPGEKHTLAGRLLRAAR